MSVSKSTKLKIKETLTKTREKRKSQTCKAYELKVDESSLNKKQKEWLKMIFIEAKWFYNFLLSKPFDFKNTEDCKRKSIIVKVNDHEEERALKYLRSTIKRSLFDRVCEAINVLSKLKKRNFKVGKLKFKKEINSIDLKLFNGTWAFKDDGKRIRVQGLKKPLRVNGFDQIPKDVDFANAQFIRKPSGYYFHITTYQTKERKITKKEEIGLDFGIKNNITTSDGQTFNWSFKETKRLKRLQRHFSKQQKYSKNGFKTSKLIAKEYEKITNQKKDAANKFVSFLKNAYDTIYIQDENLAEWQKTWFGEQIRHSILGAIKTRLKNLESTHVIDRFEPTTKMCYVCGFKNEKITLKDRIFKCPNCNHEEDRDVKAAKTTLMIGNGTIKSQIRKIPTVHRKSKPAEILPLESLKQEDMKKINSSC